MDRKHPINKLFRSPNSENTWIVFLQTLMGHALLFGDFFAEITTNGAGQPAQLWAIHPNNVRTMRNTATGKLQYVITVVPNGGPNGEPGEQIILQQEQVLHVPGLSPDGSLGYRMLTEMRNVLSTGIASQQYINAFLGNGMRPSGIITTPNELSPEAMENLTNSYSMLYGGTANAGKIPVLEQGITFTLFQTSNDDAQYKDLLQFFVYEVAR